LVGTNAEQPKEARKATGSDLVKNEEVDEGSVLTPRL
jgi:hypothetical protein